MLRFYRIQKAVFVAERGRYVSGASKLFIDPFLVFGLLPFAFTDFFSNKRYIHNADKNPSQMVYNVPIFGDSNVLVRFFV